MGETFAARPASDTMMPTRLLLLLVLGLTLAGCADAVQQPAGDPSDVPSSQLDVAGTRWESIDVTGNELPGGAFITLHFSADVQVGAHIACNTIGGRAVVENGRLVTGSGLFTTEMGCDADAHAADEWLAELLASRPAISREGDTLTITGDESSVVLALNSDGTDQTRPDQSEPPPSASETAEEIDPTESVAYAPADVVADEPTMPDEQQLSPVGLATSPQEMQAQWDRFRLTAPTPSFDFTDQVLLFTGFGESGSCPFVLDGIEVTGQTVTLVDRRDAEQVCTADFRPRTMVLAVPRVLLPGGFVTVASSGPAAVISVESSTDPPPAVPTSMGALTDAELRFDPDPAPVGSEVSVQLANSSDDDRVGAGAYLIVERRSSLRGHRHRPWDRTGFGGRPGRAR